MGIKFANNASTNITHALAADATSVSVTPDTGNLFPSIVEGKDYFYATLAGNNGLEIVKVTKRVLDTMTVERAQDGTNALLFNQGDLFELRIVAADFEDTFSQVDSRLEDTVDQVTSIVEDSIEALDASVVHKTGNETISGDKTLTGVLRSSVVGGALASDADDKDFTMFGGSAYRKGGYVKACGKDSPLLGGSVELVADNGTTNNVLRVSPDGTAVLGNNLVITSAGGTMTGILNFPQGRVYGAKDGDYRGFMLEAGEGYNAGASIILRPEDSPQQPGVLALEAFDGQNRISASLRPNDGLYVDTNKVLTSAGGTMTGSVKIQNYAPRVKLQNDSVPSNAPPSTDQYTEIEFLTSDGTRRGCISSQYFSNGTGNMVIWQQNANGHGAALSLGVGDSGIPYFNYNNSQVMTFAGGRMTGSLFMGHYALEEVYCLEFAPPAGSGHGGHLDFHFNGDTSKDFTTRIIEVVPGVLNLEANDGSYRFAGRILSGGDVKSEYNTTGSFVLPAGGTWAYHCGTNYRGWGEGSSDGAHWGGTAAGGTTIGVDGRGTACFAIRIA